MLSVAGTHWRKKSGAIIVSPGEKSGLIPKLGDREFCQFIGVYFFRGQISQ